MLNLSILFLILFSIWIILSATYSLAYLTIGAISCFLVVGLYQIIYKDKIDALLLIFVRMINYIVWLIKEIAVSSFDVSMRMWRLDPEISPQAVWLPVNLKDDVAITIYANSITLTPGSVTIGTRAGMLYVHCLTEDYLNELKEEDMLKRVQNIIKTGAR